MLVSAEQKVKTDKSILVMQSGKSSRKRPRRKGKGNESAKKAKVTVFPKSKPDKGECNYCHEVGHWRRNFNLYLEDLKKKKFAEALSSGINVIEVDILSSSS
ncbi:PREDICTED: uncharacterized protein LOC104820463 [Tarenaya hassleriana]|uniref:uncharacterized protein LOC104820463 n=1 Tax=Tarenaya hassleriana TaxID=28532 RepID=UPI00053C080A|nr:PREDICTED: uncharacterized protein LOC104820463 [Tarenaya hassleriana]